MSKTKYISISEFAKRIGISRQKVNYAANNGKFEFKKINGKKVVEPKSAKKQWDANKTETASKKNPSGKSKHKEDKSAEPPRYLGLTTADAERQEKVYKARLSELKYNEQAGKLVDAELVKKEAFQSSRRARDAIMRIPMRMSHEFAAETDPHKLEIMLAKALQKALEDYIKKEGKNEFF